MRDRWFRFCRHLVPEPLKARAFDPAVADLEYDHAARSTQPGRAHTRAVRHVRLALAILAVAVECRQLRFVPSSIHTGLRHRHGDHMLMTFVLDLRHAARRLVRQPLFAIVAVTTLGLGIGANVAVFSFVNAYLLAPLPVPAPRELVRVHGRERGNDFDIMSYPDYADARDGAPGIDLAVHVITRVAVGANDSNETRAVELVSGNYFRVMRLNPVAGRLLDARDDVAEGAHPVVVIGEALWRARYQASPAVIGQSIRLNAAPYEIVGVAPEGFRGTQGPLLADMWAPIMMQQQLRPRGPTNTLKNRGWGWLQAIGRLRQGTSVDQAQTALDRVAADLNQRFPSKSGPGHLAYTVTPATTLDDADRRALEPFIALTFAFTALLLVVTCANLAGVMQARVLARQRELAIRQSLGAGRGRLVSEWLVDCLLLAGAGGLAGVLIGRATTLLLIRFKPPAQLVGNIELGAPIDWRVVGFAAAVSLLAAVLFGLAPGLRAAARQPLSLLKEEVGTTTGGRRGGRLRRAAVVIQVAASAVLLLASGLLAASLRNLQAFDPGFRTDHLVMVSVNLQRQRIPAAQADAFRVSALGHVRALPGVSAADVVTYAPLVPGVDRLGFRIPGFTPSDGSNSVAIDDTVVGAGYFNALGLSFVAGGTWPASGATPAVVINDTMAKHFWPDRDAIGRPVELIGRGTLTVVGVVHDSAYYSIGETPMPYVYLPAEMAQPMEYTMLARTTRPADELVLAVSRAMAEADPRVVPYDAMTFEESRQIPLYPRRLLTSAASTFSVVALLLTGVGLYGVVSTSVGQRTREIGVRVALGARSSQIQSRVLRESAALVALGALVGLAGGYELATALRQWLFGVAPFDLGVYAGVVVALGVIAILAAWVPARRAARVDPVVALRT
jgi:predicted permease